MKPVHTIVQLVEGSWGLETLFPPSSFFCPLFKNKKRQIFQYLEFICRFLKAKNQTNQTK